MKTRVLLAIMTLSLLFTPMAYAYSQLDEQMYYHKNYRCYQTMTNQGYAQERLNDNYSAHCR